MDILEQPLEAVAFRIHSLPEAAAAGAAAWTCLAVLAAAAAAGVWRLRSSTAPSAAISDEVSKPLVMDASPPLMSLPETERSVGRSSEPSPLSSSLPALSPRERYTAYYHDGGCVGCCDVEIDDDEEMGDRDPEGDDDGVYGPPEADPFEWEVVRPLVPLVEATTADTARRYQRPRALGGTVVRLWDQGADRRLMAASLGRRGRAATVSSF